MTGVIWNNLAGGGLVLPNARATATITRDRGNQASTRRSLEPPARRLSCDCSPFNFRAISNPTQAPGPPHDSRRTARGVCALLGEMRYPKDTIASSGILPTGRMCYEAL